MRSCIKFSELVVLIVFAGVLLGCSGSTTAPKEILGVWKTQAGESTGVSIEITPTKIIISAEQGVVENAIVKVKSKKGHLYNSTLFSIYYTDGNREKSLMNVLYSPEEGGVLRFKSEQDTVWRKQG